MSTLVVAALLTAAVPAAAQAPVSVAQLSWMAGCWRQESGGRVADEVWMAPSGGVMLGINRTVAGERTLSTEFMHIREDAARIIFTARPSGQAEASFTMLTGGPREIVFENLGHDFPQRVIYRRDGETLIGRIEGVRNGQPQSIDYPMRRVACPQSSPP
jgi:hypothetical protein